MDDPRPPNLEVPVLTWMAVSGVLLGVYYALDTAAGPDTNGEPHGDGHDGAA